MNLVNVPSGTVTGLKLGDGVETYDVTLPAQTSGSVPFSFPTGLSPGTAYTITVVSNPAGLSCTPSANSSGTMGSASVSNIMVTCTDSVFTVSGTVQLNLVNALASNEELSISDGSDNISVQLPAGATIATLPPFSFPTPLKTGTHYSVSLPENPADLTCTVSKASGTITTSDVKDVLVTCSDNAFELSGEVTVSVQKPFASSAATVELLDGPGNLTTTTVSLGAALMGSASFTFPHLVAEGAPYTVTVATSPDGHPSGLTCTPSNNTGIMGNANVTNVVVSCSDAAYSLGGTATGLQLGSVQLTDNNESILLGQRPASFSFTFPQRLLTTARIACRSRLNPWCSARSATLPAKSWDRRPILP